jgi:lysophospholipase L1-like esterase
MKNGVKQWMPLAGLAALAVLATFAVISALTVHNSDVPATAQVPHATLTPAPTPTATPAAVLKPLAPGSAVMFVGDSWTYGTGADIVDLGFAHIAAERLAVTADVHGYGSVGYVSKGADGFGAFQARLDRDNPATAPSLVVLQGSQNDAKATPQQITDAVRALVADIHARFPQAQVVVVGPAPATVGLMTALIPVDAAVSAAASVEKVPYVSPLTAGWFNAGNLPGYMNPMNGSPHPNTAGHRHFGLLLADAITKLTSSGLG